jgi:hypothetical protein
MISKALREQVRALYGFKCGYCGVSEVESSGELEIDHFQPVAHGGSDEPANLVYACAACNRFKSDYWPGAEAGDELKLLHPTLDNLAAHLAEMTDGRLAGLTLRGWFYIYRLHLNRPALIALRRQRKAQQELQQMLADSQRAQDELRAYSRQLERELGALMKAIAELAGNQ